LHGPGHQKSPEKEIDDGVGIIGEDCSEGKLDQAPVLIANDLKEGKEDRRKESRHWQRNGFGHPPDDHEQEHPKDTLDGECQLQYCHRRRF